MVGEVFPLYLAQVGGRCRRKGGESIPGSFGGSPTGIRIDPAASVECSRIFVTRGLGQELG